MDPLTFLNTVSSVRAGLTSTASITAQTALLPGNINIGGSLSVAGNISATSLTSTGILGTTLTIGGTASAAAIQLSGTTAGTLLQFINNVSTVSGTVTTTAYAGLGVTPGAALDRYALTAHRWWTGSSGTSSGTVGMQLNTSSLVMNLPISATSVTTTYGSISTLTASSCTINTLSGQVLSLSGSLSSTGHTDSIGVYQPNLAAFVATGSNNGYSLGISYGTGSPIVAGLWGSISTRGSGSWGSYSSSSTGQITFPLTGVYIITMCVNLSGWGAVGAGASLFYYSFTRNASSFGNSSNSVPNSDGINFQSTFMDHFSANEIIQFNLICQKSGQSCTLYGVTNNYLRIQCVVPGAP